MFKQSIVPFNRKETDDKSFIKTNLFIHDVVHNFEYDIWCYKSPSYDNHISNIESVQINFVMYALRNVYTVHPNVEL